MVIMSLALKKFDLSTVPKHFVMLAIGRRRSGKTTAILSLMKAFKNRYDFAVVFCGSLATCEEYQRVVPPSFVHKEWDVKLVESMVARQERKRESKQKVEDILLVMDDLAFNPSIFKSKVMRELFFNGRHLRISIILSTQTALAIGPSLRGNCDIILCAAEKNSVYRKRIYDYYNVSFPSLKLFDSCFLSMTVNFGLLILVSFGQGYAIESNVFHYKAEFPLPRFKMNRSGRWWTLKAPVQKQTAGLFVKREEVRPQKSESESIRVQLKYPSVRKNRMF